jgi:hypothetical protein
MHLMCAREMGLVDAHGAGQLVPRRRAIAVAGRAEPPRARRKQMRGVRLERHAHQRAPAGRLPPLEHIGVRQFGVVTPTLINVAIAAALVVRLSDS